MATTTTPTTQGDRAGRERRPRALTRHVNVPDTERTLSVLGGGALLALAFSRAHGWRRAAILGAGGMLVQRGLTGHCQVYQALGVDRSEGRLLASGATVDEAHASHVRRAATIARPRAELYAFWRDFSNLPRFMHHLESVSIVSEQRSRWTVRAPGGSVSWDAVVTQERDGELIAWESVEPSQVANRGSVRFEDAPAGRGTIVHVDIAYEAPAGPIGRLVAFVTGEHPETQVREDLRRFKQLMETGEIPTTEGQPSCR
ncbi:MAG TPA: SRPBCC family protein [Gemmatimonadaceae bacterium]